MASYGFILRGNALGGVQWPPGVAQQQNVTMDLLIITITIFICFFKNVPMWMNNIFPSLLYLVRCFVTSKIC